MSTYRIWRCCPVPHPDECLTPWRVDVPGSDETVRFQRWDEARSWVFALIGAAS